MSDWFKDLFIDEAKAALAGLSPGGGSPGGGEDDGLPSFPIGDGDTHIWVDIPEERRIARMRFNNLSGTVTIDWGDGTEPTVYTDSTNATTVSPEHEYKTAGIYVISVHLVEGSCTFTSRMVDGGSKLSNPRVMLRKVDWGSSWGNTLSSQFIHCYALEDVHLPEGTTLIQSSMCQECYGLTSVVIPSTVKSIGSYAFNTCARVAYYDFSKHTKVPELKAISAFSDGASDCQFRVPAALVDEWKAATNWANYASKIVGV